MGDYLLNKQVVENYYSPEIKVSKEEYCEIIKQNILNDRDLTLLEIFLEMEDNSAPASLLAKRMKYKAHSAVNLHFARISKKVSSFSGKLPYSRKNGKYWWWTLLASGFNNKYDKLFYWRLRSELISALKLEGVFDEKEMDLPDEISSRKPIREGFVRVVQVNRYERDRKARKECINYHGLDCKVCGFNFEEVYGEIGQNFIHVHHLKPVSEIKTDYIVNPIKDLIPLCPNCHSMIHMANPIFTIDELKMIMKENTAGNKSNQRPCR